MFLLSDGDISKLHNIRRLKYEDALWFLSIKLDKAQNKEKL
ncbi:MAG: hypothetical protein Kow0037_00630 [Calditrichia bacterium]